LGLHKKKDFAIAKLLRDVKMHRVRRWADKFMDDLRLKDTFSEGSLVC